MTISLPMTTAEGLYLGGAREEQTRRGGVNAARLHPSCTQGYIGTMGAPNRTLPLALQGSSL